MAPTGNASSPHVIGPRIVICGSLAGQEDLVVEGRIEGQIRLTGHLRIAEGAKVEASVDTESVEVSGEVTGDIVASRAVSIEPGGRVFGNVTAPRVSIADGAHIHGAVEMKVVLPSDLSNSRRK